MKKNTPPMLGRASVVIAAALIIIMCTPCAFASVGAKNDAVGATGDAASVVAKKKSVKKSPKIKTPKGYRLVWHDEFDAQPSVDGRPVLPSDERWWYEEGNHGWGNRELQNYVAGHRDGDTLAYVSNGTLKIKTIRTADGEVRSIRMNSSAHWQYGYFEARLKMPVGKGTWPAFWMMPKFSSRWPACGEIDILEIVGFDPTRVFSSIHCARHFGGNSSTGDTHLPDTQTAFHVYACEWTPDFIRFFVDGRQIRIYENDGTGSDTWPFDAPFYLKLNTAFGGNLGGREGVDFSCLPAIYEIDYVRVFQKK